MKIKDESWHFRVQKYSGDALTERGPWVPPVDYCAYFWRLLFAPVLCLTALYARLLCTVLGFVDRSWRREPMPVLGWMSVSAQAVGGLALLASRFGGPPWDLENMALIGVVGLLGPLACILAFAVLAVLASCVMLVVLVVLVCRWVGRLWSGDDTKSLVGARLHAWKAKRCPLIEYEYTS